MWKALYRNPATGEEDWKTVWADHVNEASKKADGIAKKGFVRISVNQEKRY